MSHSERRAEGGVSGSALRQVYFLVWDSMALRLCLAGGEGEPAQLPPEVQWITVFRIVAMLPPDCNSAGGDRVRGRALARELAAGVVHSGYHTPPWRGIEVPPPHPPTAPTHSRASHPGKRRPAPPFTRSGRTAGFPSSRCPSTPCSRVHGRWHWSSNMHGSADIRPCRRASGRLAPRRSSGTCSSRRRAGEHDEDTITTEIRRSMWWLNGPWSKASDMLTSRSVVVVVAVRNLSLFWGGRRVCTSACPRRAGSW